MNDSILHIDATTIPGLLPHHLLELRASGLSDVTIRAAGIQSETKYERLRAILDWKEFPKRMAPAIVFPFRGEDGTNGYFRIKPDNPRKIRGKPVKYESPKGQRNRVYYPLGVLAAIETPLQELLITEGEKKSLKATQEHFPCIGLVGVFGWKDGKSESLLPELERIDWHGRPVYIAFDSDIATKPEVQDAEARLANHLAKRGAKVKCVRLPDGPPDANGKPTKMGLDDFLVAYGPGPLRRLLDEAIPPGDLQPVEMKDLAKNLDPAAEVKRILETEQRDGVSTLRFWRGTFWRWRNGRYIEISKAEARAAIVTALNRNWSHLTTRITGDVVDQLQAQSLLFSRVDPPTWLERTGDEPPADSLLATRNGLVDLAALVAGRDTALLELTPRFFTTSALDYDFALDAPRPTAWLDFLASLWPHDPASIDTLQEWFGYCLAPDTTQQKILLVIGPKRSGKGTIARVLRELIGRENVGGPTLCSLATNFGLWPLLGRTVAIVSDARLSGRSDQAVVVERLLSISGEDALTIDRKNLEPVTAKLLARFMIISNELPRLSDSSGALAGRFIVLRMTQSFYGHEDHQLTGKLLAELPGILLWAIEGWRRLHERGRFIQPDSGRELHESMADLSSPVGQFVRERCVVAIGRRVAVDDLFGEWRRWCEVQGRDHPGTVQTFARDLIAAIPSIRSSRPRESGERVRVYDGIGLRS